MLDLWERFSPAELAATFGHFARTRCGAYAPLYARLAAGIADDPGLLALAAHAFPGQSPPDLMLAAVHFMLARRNDHPLARYYPSLVPDPEPAPGAFPDFRAFCLDHRDELAAQITTRRVQTDEVRRCSYLLPAIMLAAATADRPLALIEAGAGAGLGLGLDGYAYDYGTGRIIGDPASALTLRSALKGALQPPLDLPVPAVAWRAGIDRHPVDPRHADDAAWLRALVWPDHRDRAAILDNALRAAAARPPVQVHGGNAAERLPALVAAAPWDAVVCVFHTAFLAHFPPPDRQRFEHLVVGLSASRPIYWVQAEPRSNPAEPRLRLAICENGAVTREWPLGHYHPHGEWLEWAASVPSASHSQSHYRYSAPEITPDKFPPPPGARV